MKFARAKYLVLFFLLASCSTAFAEVDVNNINIQGDSTLMGMRIESSYFADGAFLIETTGARFEYVKGQLKLYQGLDSANRRLLSTITFDNEPNFVKVEANDDHILFWSENINLGIYGDSTLILTPKKRLKLGFKGNFKPDYEGRHNSELLLIDDLGGLEILPPRGDILLYDKVYPESYKTGCTIKKIELGKKDWIVEYQVEPDEKIMIAAFPGRAFDWEKSFKSQIVIVQTVLGRGAYNPDGQTLPDYVFREWSRYIDIVIIWYQIYKDADYRAPYIIGNEAEFRRVLRICDEVGIKVAVYTSLSYHYSTFNDVELFYSQIKELRDKYGIDGVYIDGLGYDQIPKWEMMRRLRELFGPDGVIVLHSTGRGSPLATTPNVDCYSDVVFSGENVEFKTIDDPYTKYQLRKYGISNTIAMMAPGTQTRGMSKKDIVDIMLKMNGRCFWWGEGLRTGQPPPNDWRTEPGPEFQYYLKQLEKIEKSYRAIKKFPEDN